MNFTEILEQTFSARGLSPDTCESRDLLYALLAACRRHQRTLSPAAGGNESSITFRRNSL